MNEKQVERRLTEGVKRQGGMCLKFVSPGNAGAPDRIIILPGGSVIFAELKSDTGRLSQIQKHTIGKMRDLGADVRVLRGAAAVDEFLSGVFVK